MKPEPIGEQHLTRRAEMLDADGWERDGRVMWGWRWFGLFGLSVCSSCSSATTTQADCDKIASEIRANGGTADTCASTVPATVVKFGKACAALKDCNDHCCK